MREDFRLGAIAAQFHNAHREKGARTLTPHDFFPNIEGEPAPIEPETELQKAERIIAGMMAMNKRLKGAK